ncbi:MAG: rhodanese-like domain-containing protein [Chloroflexi bacterium]|nr:rhodanese-like domain-containing protein [Chloroflexota bacterium]
MQFLRALMGTPTPSLSAMEAQARLKQAQPPFLLDVRTAAEFRDAHIQGAVLIPLDELEDRLAEVPRERAIICVCRSGSRSGMATSQLVRAGYDASNLQGGMIAWGMAGLPVKKGKGR